MEYEEIKKRVLYLLDQMRPYLQNDGGDMEFIEMSVITIKNGIEETLKKYIPEIKEVVNVLS